MKTQKRFQHFTALTGLACAGLLVGSTAAMAQFTSTAELKLACETSPGNIVNLNVNTQISTGPRPPLAEIIDTPCTLVLSPQVTFSAGQVGVNFNGALTVQGGSEAHVLLNESEFVATAVSVTQSNKSTLVLDRSLLQASAGNITLSTGDEGVVDLRGPITNGNLVATGAIAVSGGQKFIGSLAGASVQAGSDVSMSMSGAESTLTTNTSTVGAGGAITVTGGAKFAGQLNDTILQAGTGLSVTMNGADGLFSTVASTLDTMAGPLSITSNGTKNTVDLKLGSVATAGSGLTVSLNGAESLLNANEFTLSGGTGSVTLQSQGNVSKLIAMLGTINAGGAVTVQAATTAQLGVTHVEEVVVTAGGDIKIETGNLGFTEAKGNVLTSPASLVRIASGVGGACESLENIITAATEQICL